MGTKAGKDSQMEEDKDSKDAAQYKRLRNKIELEKQYADKENSDKSEPSGPGASFDDKPNNPSVGILHEGQSITLSYWTRSKRTASEVKLSEGRNLLGQGRDCGVTFVKACLELELLEAEYSQ